MKKTPLSIWQELQFKYPQHNRKQQTQFLTTEIVRNYNKNSSEDRSTDGDFFTPLSRDVKDWRVVRKFVRARTAES